mmetsp:Transcript_7434/g.12491  ORF Transcript_7434/g.12491 Transcript_7434/m.12491 type:complete len:295 (+) Transcript_7434:184-1068(+)
MLKVILLLIFMCGKLFLGSGSEADYILIDSRNGLSNRLRLLAAYMVVAEEIYNTSHIIMVWELNAECVGHFLEIFEPIENVTFIAPSQEHLFKSRALAHFGPSYASFPEVLKRFHLDMSPLQWHDIRRDKYRHFIPISYILHEVFQFVTRKNICNCVGVHVRHTDLESLFLNKPNHSSDKPFLDFIDAHSSSQCIYLMTDNPSSQQLFLQRYGASRLLVYDTVRDKSAHHEAHHRFTSLFHTIVDVLITAHTREFLGTPGSSLTELVSLMNVTFVARTRFYSSCSTTATADTLP